MNLQRAIEIAVEAHRGQLDKGGNLYVLHPLRVMMNLDSEDEKIVGVLHDVVEDCESEGWTWDRLRSEGFSEIVIDALQSVSKSPEEAAEFGRLKKAASDEALRDHYLAFIARAKANEIGRKVKIADIWDNMDVSRIANPTSDDNRRLGIYRAALEVLKGEGE